MLKLTALVPVVELAVDVIVLELAFVVAVLKQAALDNTGAGSSCDRARAGC